MSSFFNWIARAAVGSNKDEMPRNFQSVFHDSKIGLKIEGVDNKPVVKSIVPGSEGEKSGVRPGDVIVAIDGDAVAGTVGRPVRISFLSPVNAQTSLASSNSSYVMSAKRQMTPSSLFGEGNSGSHSSSSSSTGAAPVSEEEKDRRRQMMLQAALEREQSWDKKVATAGRNRNAKNQVDASGRPIFDHTEAAQVGHQNPETQRVVSAARRSEERLAASMGYDPFRPYMSFASAPAGAPSVAAVVTVNKPAAVVNASTSSSSSSGTLAHANTAGEQVGTHKPTVKSSGAVPQLTSSSTPESQSALESPLAEIEADARTECAVDEALAMLLSSFVPPDSAKSKLALITIDKMLSNLANNTDEPKFRSIRLMNEAFQTRVVSVPGGLELMIAAGFELITETETQGPQSTEWHLWHSMSTKAERKLQYTLTRLSETRL